MSDKTNPDYYKAGASDALAFVMAAGLDYPSGCIVKYLCRCGKKPGESRLDDLQKAKVYLDRMIEAEEQGEAAKRGPSRVLTNAINLTQQMILRDIPKPRKQKRGKGKK
jgi:hypothetical protein